MSRLNQRLEQLGAATFGSEERRLARLHRFLELKEQQQQATQRLQKTREVIWRNNQEYSEQRFEELKKTDFVIPTTRQSNKNAMPRMQTRSGRSYGPRS
jgi:hypothetical protein